MEAKDMNFTLDRRRVEAVQDAVAKAVAANQSGHSAEDRSSTAKKTAPLAPVASGGALLVWPMLNTAALAAFALWLYWQPASSVAPVKSLSEADLRQHLQPLQEQIVELREALGSEREYTRDLEARILAMAEKTVAQPVAEESPPPKPPPLWTINAGEYAEKSAAAAAADSLQRLGYGVAVSYLDSGLWRLRITGFSQRMAAEEAAREIMAGSDLNGLWVSRESGQG